MIKQYTHLTRKLKEIYPATDEIKLASGELSFFKKGELVAKFTICTNLSNNAVFRKINNFCKKKNFNLIDGGDSL